MEINAKEAFELIKNKKVKIIDVRTKTEFNNEHLKSCINIDYYSNNAARKLEKLDKSKTYLVYCAHGERSYNTVVFMKSIGFNEVYTLDGGITLWIERGYPVFK